VAGDQRSVGHLRDRIVSLYLGLLADYQGAAHIVEAAQRVIAARSDAHFLVMGYPGFDKYRAYAAQLGVGDHFTFTGRVPYEQAPLYLRVGDIALAPKLSLTEGAGKILNYMAAGLPTVAFDTPVARETWPTLVYAARRCPPLQTILELMAAPDQRQAVGAALRARAASRFSWERAAQTVEAVYDAVRTPAPEARRAALSQLQDGDQASKTR
jgi:glycosyltransferase involved in cell wall biosynthesis